MIPYIDTVDIVLSAVFVALFLVCIFKQNNKPKVLCAYIFILGLTIYSCYVTGNNALAITVITCLAIRKSDLKKYFEYIYKVERNLLVFHTGAAIIGSCLGMVSITQEIGGILRYDFGMQHPNTFAAMVFNIMIMHIWIVWDKIRAKQILTMTIKTIIVYEFCKTRTTLMIMITVILILLCKKNKWFIRKISALTAIVVPLLSFSMAGCIILYLQGNDIALKINQALNARVLLGAYAYEHSGITFFGQCLDGLYTGTTWDGIWQLNAFTFDCLYSYLIINQGIVWLVLLSLTVLLLVKQKKTKDNVAILSWALYGMTEVQGLNCFSCTPIILLSKLFERDEKDG